MSSIDNNANVPSFGVPNVVGCSYYATAKWKTLRYSVNTILRNIVDF
jgi:hypothetical protein